MIQLGVVIWTALAPQFAFAYDDRRVSTTLRQVLTEFSEFFHLSRDGLLIQTSLGSGGGLGALRTKRSG